MARQWKLYQIIVQDKTKSRTRYDEDGGWIDCSNVEGYAVGRNPQEAIRRFVGTNPLSDYERDLHREAELVDVPDFRIDAKPLKKIIA